MTLGKNKRISKGKKGGKKKTVDPLSRKEWFDFRAPVPFEKRTFGKTCVTRTTGQRIASEVIKGRVVESTLADLNNNADNLAWRKVKLQIEDVQGRNCLTNFHGIDTTRDKLCQFIRKWQTLIEAWVEAKTLDGYVLRLFCIGFTTKNQTQRRRTSYARHSQVKLIRKKMMDIITKEVQTSTITELIKKFNTESIGEQIETACKNIYPLQNVLIRKVKTIRKPKGEVGRLQELHDEKNMPAIEEEEGAKNLLKA